MKMFDRAYFLEFMGMKKRVTRDQWIAAERAAGFRPKSGDGEATGGFSSSQGITGTIEYGLDIEAKKLGIEVPVLYWPKEVKDEKDSEKNRKS